MKKYLIFILIILVPAIFSLIFLQMVFLPKESFSQEEVFFRIEKGEGSKEIALNLQRENLIRQAIAFRAYVLARGFARNLKAGEYFLSPSMNIPDLAEIFLSGATIKEKITIIEGWSLKEIGLYFENKEMFQAEEVWRLLGFSLLDHLKESDFSQPKDFSEEFGFLEDKPEGLGLEGYLFPDTYQIDRKETLESIVRRMLANFEKKLTRDLREEIQKQDKSIFEIVTMASLIEKEVRTFEDKKLVSGILWKRLGVDMPLQVDATIAYFLEDGKWTFDQMRREIHLARGIDSPYNTYKYKGLPPGPISNPGMESILAAIGPKESDFWYYLSTPEGETIFSRTLSEHNMARAKYLK